MHPHHRASLCCPTATTRRCTRRARIPPAPGAALATAGAGNLRRYIFLQLLRPGLNGCAAAMRLSFWFMILHAYTLSPRRCDATVRCFALPILRPRAHRSPRWTLRTCQPVRRRPLLRAYVVAYSRCAARLVAAAVRLAFFSMPLLAAPPLCEFMSDSPSDSSLCLRSVPPAACRRVRPGVHVRLHQLPPLHQR